MREHEVPTHVQAEDKVLLGFTFPQVVAMTAVCALSYGAYRYAPVGPSEVRMALAVLLGLAGFAAVVGQVGGRRLPLVAADLLRYRLGTRLYVGPSSQLVRSEPPAPAQPVKSGPGQLRLMVRRAGKTLRNLRRRRNRRERQGGRMPFNPHHWFRKRRARREQENDNINGPRVATREGKEKRRRFWRAFLGGAAVAVFAAALPLAVPQMALADGHENDEGWSSDEVEFRPQEPVEGRRLFVEELTVSGDWAAVTLRAATPLDIRVRAYGGLTGRFLRFWGAASLDEGERIDYSFPLHGPTPSLTFSWEDTLGQAGADLASQKRHKRINLTDRDARLMKGRHGIVAGYNAQAMVSPTEPDVGATGMLVTAVDVVDEANDNAMLAPMMERAEETTGTKAQTTLADAGYFAGSHLEECASRGQQVVVSESRQRFLKDPYHKDRFTYDEQSDSFMCPQGQTLAFVRIQHANGVPLRLYRASGAVCQACPAFRVCTRAKEIGRSLAVGPHDAALRRHRAWMANSAAREAYRLRKQLVEPVFGIIKEQQGARRFLLRGLTSVAAEWTMLATAFNLRTLWRAWRSRAFSQLLHGPNLRPAS